MDTPVNEWREEFEKSFCEGKWIGVEVKGDDIVDFIQKTLDQHSARLVAKARDCTRGLCAEDCVFCDNEITLDQAKDIIKNNK